MRNAADSNHGSRILTDLYTDAVEGWEHAPSTCELRCLCKSSSVTQRMSQDPLSRYAYVHNFSFAVHLLVGVTVMACVCGQARRSADGRARAEGDPGARRPAGLSAAGRRARGVGGGAGVAAALHAVAHVQVPSQPKLADSACCACKLGGGAGVAAALHAAALVQVRSQPNLVDSGMMCVHTGRRNRRRCRTPRCCPCPGTLSAESGRLWHDVRANWEAEQASLPHSTLLPLSRYPLSRNQTQSA